MRFATLFAAIVLAVMPSGASATCSGVFCTDVLIERLTVNATGMLIRTSGTEDNLDCDPGSGDQLTAERSDAAYDEWYAMALTAYVQQAPMSFRLAGGTGTCTVLYTFQEQ